eukprot:11054740-Ditylum_brightwellii.AAC.1
MGIKGFRAWFESQFPEAMTTVTRAKKKSSSSSKNSNNDNIGESTEMFEHVLIDVNQLLHVSLRRSRSEGHALTLLIKELDKCTDLARPTRSVVLAFDGPPGAAKLATQRRRRYGTVMRGDTRKAKLEYLQKVGILGPGSKIVIDKHDREEKTLCITP